MKRELPILFSSEMVRAILAGRKSVTRRVIKPQPVQPKEGAYFDSYNKTEQWNWWTRDHKQILTQIIKCPQGQEGTVLWVRETFCPVDDTEFDGKKWIDYRATPKYNSEHPAGWENAPEDEAALKWKPSIFMPRAVSRIDLENLGVRVEAVQDISEEDAIKEGVGYGFRMNAGWPDYSHINKNGVCELTQDTAQMSFATLWDSINAKPKRAKHNPYTHKKQDCYVSYPWEDIREERWHRGLIWHVVGNPLCWVIKFRKIKPCEKYENIQMGIKKIDPKMEQVIENKLK